MTRVHTGTIVSVSTFWVLRREYDRYYDICRHKGILFILFIRSASLQRTLFTSVAQMSNINERWIRQSVHIFIHLVLPLCIGHYVIFINNAKKVCVEVLAL